MEHACTRALPRQDSGKSTRLPKCYLECLSGQQPDGELLLVSAALASEAPSRCGRAQCPGAPLWLHHLACCSCDVSCRRTSRRPRHEGMCLRPSCIGYLLTRDRRLQRGQCREGTHVDLIVSEGQGSGHSLGRCPGLSPEAACKRPAGSAPLGLGGEGSSQAHMGGIDRSPLPGASDCGPQLPPG